jgi:hypothetical protein
VRSLPRLHVEAVPSVATQCIKLANCSLNTATPLPVEMEPFYLLHFTYGMDYTRKGVFTPGKYGEWRFDKRTYAQLPPPRHLSEPPRGMRNALVRIRSTRQNSGQAASFWPTQSAKACAFLLALAVHQQKDVCAG